MNSIIVIPTYNEKDNIQPLVESIFKFAPEINILIVDDNSPDGTGRIVDELRVMSYNTCKSNLEKIMVCYGLN